MGETSRVNSVGILSKAFKMLSILSIIVAIAGINAQTDEEEATSAPSGSPTTPAPIDPLTIEMELCVVGADLVGPTVSLSRNDEYGYMEIRMVGTDDRWFGFGFGNKFMTNTYAIISVDADTTEERILGEKEYDNNGNVIVSSGMGTLLSDNSWISEPTVTVADGDRTVVFRRPYAHEASYDFTAFMSANKKSLDWISAIGMIGSAGTFGMHNIQNPDAADTLERDSGTMGTNCLVNDDSTPSPVPPGTDTSDGYVAYYRVGFVMAVFVGILV